MVSREGHELGQATSREGLKGKKRIQQAARVLRFCTYFSGKDCKSAIYCIGDLPDCANNFKQKYFDYSPDCSDNSKKNISTTSSSTSSTTSRRYVRRLCLATLGGSPPRTRANYRQRSGTRHQLAPECEKSRSRPTISSTSAT
jgi:hypothetical protein